ncbi:MAG: TIGR02679 family protein [Bacillaceae bacterium]|nr:TIGR02679 family protein [Bacillaceae bacterium]
MTRELIDDALQFFRTYPVYEGLFILFKKKYQSLGKMSGTVSLLDFSHEELEELAAFLGSTSNELREQGKLPLQAFERQIGRTKFDGVSLVELLEAFFEETILTNAQQKRTKQLFIEKTLSQLVKEFPNIQFWFKYVQNKTADTYWIYRLMEEKLDTFYEEIEIISKAFKLLPNEAERMAMFSQRVTNNPHAFDQQTEIGKLWLHLLSVHSRESDVEVTLPSDSEGISLLLEKYLLYRDDITNFVTAVNILAETNDGVQNVWQAAAACDTPMVLNVPIRELVNLTRAYPANGGKTVWVVENSGVFSTILDRFPSAPLLCTHGQFKLASLKLMDLLVKEDCQIMYAGDFDPEGVLMLQRLMQRYGRGVLPWRMDVNHYHLSHPTVLLSEDRLKKLNNITSNELVSLKDEMLTRKKAGYQEALVSLYDQDLI